MVVVVCCEILLAAVTFSTLQGQNTTSITWQGWPCYAPVIAVLQAVQNSDVVAFKNAYSKRIREANDHDDWEKTLKNVRATMTKQWGDFQVIKESDFKVKDFDFGFTGTTGCGTVTLKHKGKGFSVAVIQEGDNWKIDSAELAAASDQDDD